MGLNPIFGSLEADIPNRLSVDGHDHEPIVFVDVRTVTVLAVHEHEVQDISFMNTLATIAFSICGAFVGFAAGILTNAAFAEKMGPTASAAVKMGVPICAIVAILAVILGCVALRRRRSTLAQIKEQSETVQP